MTETRPSLQDDAQAREGSLKVSLQRSLLRLLRLRSAVLGLILVLLFLSAGLFANVLAPYSPVDQVPKDRLQPPNATYWLGTDELGRDILSRIFFGIRYSLLVSVASVSIACLLGTLLGMTAGYVGGLNDSIIMRAMDVLFAFPAILLALFIVTALGPGARNTTLAIATVYLPIFARVVRGPTLVIKSNEYILAARALGSGHGRILARHILPNVTAPILVQVSLALSWVMLTEASLSFLGLGTIPPNPSLGGMLSDSRILMELAPWTALFPGLAIMVGVLGFSLLGDGLRDLLDPHLHL